MGIFKFLGGPGVVVAESGSWAEPFLNSLKPILVILFSVVGAVGVAYAIFLGFLLAKAEDENKRKQAKKRVFNTISGLFLIVVLITPLFLVDLSGTVDFVTYNITEYAKVGEATELKLTRDGVPFTEDWTVVSDFSAVTISRHTATFSMAGHYVLKIKTPLHELIELTVEVYPPEAFQPGETVPELIKNPPSEPPVFPATDYTQPGVQNPTGGLTNNVTGVLDRIPDITKYHMEQVKYGSKYGSNCKYTAIGIMLNILYGTKEPNYRGVGFDSYKTNEQDASAAAIKLDGPAIDGNYYTGEYCTDAAVSNITGKKIGTLNELKQAIFKSILTDRVPIIIETTGTGNQHWVAVVNLTIDPNDASITYYILNPGSSSSSLMQRGDSYLGASGNRYGFVRVLPKS